VFLPYTTLFRSNLATKKKVKLWLKATPKEPIVKITISIKNNFFLPYLSDNLPTIGVVIANPNVYSVIPHVQAVAETSKEELIVVKAALIIPLSKAAINTPINKTIKLIFILEVLSFSATCNISIFK